MLVPRKALQTQADHRLQASCARETNLAYLPLLTARRLQSDLDALLAGSANRWPMPGLVLCEIWQCPVAESYWQLNAAVCRRRGQHQLLELKCSRHAEV